MICSEARIRTAHAGAYLTALSGRLAGGTMKEEARTSEPVHEAHFDLQGGHCDLEADTERLVISCRAQDEAVVGELRALVEQSFPETEPGDEIAFTWHTVDL